MDKNETLNKIKKIGLLAVIRGPSEDLTIKMVEALIKGGIRGIEITYTSPNAEEIVRTLNNQYRSEIVLGMGTLTMPEQAKTAKEAGARFLVSPICEPKLVAAMVESGLLTMAGAFTPTEVFQAFRQGIDVIKIFPGSLATPAYIKSLKGPFPDIPMMPTGGVSIDNVSDWFATGAVAVGAGSSLCPVSLARQGNFKGITERAEAFLRVVNESLRIDE